MIDFTKQLWGRSFEHKLVVACLALTVIALFPLGGAFYILLRLVFCACLVWFWWHLYKETDKVMPIHLLIGGLAVLYNPLFLVSLGSKIVWLPVNLGTVYLMYWAANRLK
jgi:hypothetical protein